MILTSEGSWEVPLFNTGKPPAQCLAHNEHHMFAILLVVTVDLLSGPLISVVDGNGSGQVGAA